MQDKAITVNNQLTVKKQWQKPEVIFIDGDDIQIRPKASKMVKEMYTPSHALSYHS